MSAIHRGRAAKCQRQPWRGNSCSTVGVARWGAAKIGGRETWFPKLGLPGVKAIFETR